ncbi:hypothetical protein MKD50_19640 [Cupriavidus sp. WGtm5]|uniref:hypothetical protein n=1 Tax=Cupriavidus sp. WGtm5 TaxID=2919926 RepID=UPI0020904A16|nr:hypothetical protein [Cupriavidus sp. WGtm5]MCO4891599.1 hypothetical protein [Cupriavidus sp. WGtm5]
MHAGSGMSVVRGALSMCRTIANPFYRFWTGEVERHVLVIVAVQEQRGDGDRVQVVGEVDLRKLAYGDGRLRLAPAWQMVPTMLGEGGARAVAISPHAAMRVAHGSG